MLEQTGQKISIVNEAAAAAGRVIDVLDFDGSRGNLAELGSALSTVLVGGAVATSGLQAYRLETKGVAHVYVQPYAALAPLPGEHHAVFPGSLGGAASLMPTTFGRRWVDAGTGLAGRLSCAPGLSAALDGVDWHWRMPGGEVRQEWLVAIRPHAGGGTHVAMAGLGSGIAADEGGTRAGFRVFSALCRALTEVLGPFQVPEAHFLGAVRFGMLFEAFALGSIASGLPPSRGLLVDHGENIRACLAPHTNKNLHVAPAIPPKKHANALRSILPAAAQHLPVVALIDLTLFGSASEGVVLTPTHCFWRDSYGSIEFPWTDVCAVGAPSPGSETIPITVARLGDLSFPTGGRSDAFGALFWSFRSRP